MSQRRKIAFAYIFAVPAVLAIVLFQHASLFGVRGFEVGMTQAAEEMRKASTVSSLLSDVEVEAQKCTPATGDKAYQATVSRLRETLKQLGEDSENVPDAKVKFQKLDALVESQIAACQRVVDTMKKHEASVRGHQAAAPDPPSPSDDIAKTLADVQGIQRIRLEQQGEAAARSVRLATSLTTYGGGLLIWLVGVAAFLLFHDEKARAWAGVERRVHTKVLETLPLGVSVATDAGIILYANPSEEDLFGSKPGCLLGANAERLHALDDDNSGQTVSEILERLDLNKVWSGQLPIRKQDGTTLRIPSWIVNLELPGKIYRVFIHNTD